MKLTYLIIGFFIIYTANAQKKCTSLPSKIFIIRTLENYLIEGSIEYGDISLDCNYDSIVKQKLIYYISNNLTNKQIDSFINIKLIGNSLSDSEAERQKPLNYFEYLRYKNLTEIKLKESIYNDYKSRFRKQNSIIKTIGLLNITEAIPILEKAMYDSINFDKKYVKIALAKLGSTKIKEEIVLNLKSNESLQDSDWTSDFYNKAGVLIYFATQEDIFRIVSFLDSKAMYTYLSNGDQAKGAYEALNFLQAIVLNEDFQKIVAFLRGDRAGMNTDSDEKLQEAKKWLITNKGKYIINKNFKVNF